MLYPLAGAGALRRRYALPASFSSVTSQGEGRYGCTLNFGADQTGGAFTGAGLRVGYRVLTATQQIYSIEQIADQSFGTATVTLAELNPGTGSPTGAAVAYQYDGTTDLIPLLPQNSAGMSQALATIIQNHNTQVLAIAAVTGEQVTAVTEDFLDSVASQPLNELRALNATVQEVFVNNEVRVSKPIVVSRASAVRLGAGGYFTLEAGGSLTFEGSFVAPPTHYAFRGNPDAPVRLAAGQDGAWVDWFGAAANATHDAEYTCTNRGEATKCYHPFRRAKLAVGTGGTVRFARGAYYMDDETQAWLDANTAVRWRRSGFCLRWHERRVDGSYAISHRLRVVLDPGTVLLPAGDGSAEYGSTEFAPYRDAGWRVTVADVVTYVDATAHKGSTRLTSRVPGQWAAFQPGQVAYLCAGALGGFDQHDGQFIEVDRVEGDTLHLARPLACDYREAYSSSGAAVTTAFTVPADGAEVDIVLALDTNGSNRVPGATETGNGLLTVGEGLFSVAGDLYQHVQWTPSSTQAGTLRARKLGGHGNQPAGQTVAAGTRVYRHRAVIPTPTCVIGGELRASGAVIAGWRNGRRGSNSYQCATYAVREFWKPLPADPKAGLHYDSDGGYGWVQQGGTVRSVGDVPANAQWARSAAFGVQRGMTFRNARWDASERANHILVEDCDFFMDFADHRHQESVIIVDETTAEVSFRDCRINATGANQIVKGSGVGTFTHSAGGGSRFHRLNVVANDCRTLFDGPFVGLVDIDDVRVEGSLRGLFAGSSAKHTPGYGEKGGRYTVGGGTRVRRLHYQGTLDYLTGSPWQSVDMEAEIVWLGYTRPGGDAGARARGTILRRNEDGSPADYSDVRLRLILWNWPWLDGGIAGANLDWGRTGYCLIEFRNTDRGSGPQDFYQAWGNIDLPHDANT